MPTYKISQLTTATAVSATNQFEINQNGTSKSVEVSVIDAYIKSTSNLPVVVSVSSATDAVRITQTGTGNALVVEDSANPDSSPFVVDASGNVGIGTSSPGQKLDVSGTSRYTFNVANAYTLQTSINAAGSAFADDYKNALSHIWQTSGSERMRIDSSGNVGIGTSSPSNKLSIVSSTQYSGITLGNGTYTTVELVGFSATNDEGGITFKQAGTTNAQILANGTSFFNGGNVGIGTSAPTNKLSVVGSMNASNYYMQDSSAAAAGTYGFGNSNGPFIQTWGNSSAQAGALLFATSGSERARIDSSGRLGVGTSSPDTNFLVTFSSSNGALAANTTGTSDGIAMNLNTGGTAGQSVYAIPVRTAGTLRGGIQWNGTNLLYNNSSDYRLKTNVAPMQGALNRISLLNPCTYTWIEQQISGEGFIAHELQSVIPAAVTGEKDAVNEDGSIKPQGVDYSKIVVHLVAAIQEQQTHIAALEARLTALEAK